MTVAKGGFRQDLGIYVRSKWEANYARWLKFLVSRGEILKWEYEADVFGFPVKRGTTEYRPDFKITNNDGSVIYHEVKGYHRQEGMTALKRMEKYYPEVEVIVIDQEWFAKVRKDGTYRLIEGWEE